MELHGRSEWDGFWIFTPARVLSMIHKSFIDDGICHGLETLVNGLVLGVEFGYISFFVVL